MTMKHLPKFALILAAPLVVPALAEPPDRCNVVWESPSADARGSMPIGNGDIGLNVWVEPSGDLCFFIGKTDAWDESVRLLKLTKVRVRLDPALDPKVSFTQTLNLHDGTLDIDSSQHHLRVWVDANHPVVQVDASSLNRQPFTATATIEPWRKVQRPLGTAKSGSNSEYFATGYTSLPAISYPDTILPRTDKQIAWFHRNVESPWLASLKLQKLDAIAQSEPDPILHRTMGGLLRGDNFAPVSDTELRSVKPELSCSLRIHVLTKIADTPDDWLAALNQQADTIDQLDTARRFQQHTDWWHAFWDRSWIQVVGGVAITMPTNDHPWRVATASDGGSRFAGTISDPLVAGRAMSPEEINALAAKPRDDANIPPASVPLAAGCTVAAWVKPAPGEAGRILDKCTAGKPDGFTFDTYPGLALRWIVGNNTMIHPNCLKPNEWQHVAATADPSTGTRRIYLNGKLLKEERGDTATQTLTRAYALQRWMNACGGRGAFPIKFNGSIFVVDNKFDADYRAWGGGYWWQNTRLPYWSMLQSGDYEMMRPLFDMYLKALPARKLAAKTYYNHGGAFFPETMSFWGNYLDQGDLGYGTDRSGKPDGLTDNEYIRRYWQGGLEMVAMMLDYHDHTADPRFRDETLLPFATEILAFFDQHWQRGPDGKILFHPAMSLETWWDATNPLPEIAALRFLLPRLIVLTNDPALKSAWSNTFADLPPVPLSADGKRIAPAEKFATKRNVENPELYAVFPYLLYGVERPDLTVARDTFAARGSRNNCGWCQDAIHAACLGLAEEAATMVTARAAAVAGDFRFPAMWGPNFDWTPDQDHGSNTMTALQRMILQSAGDRILLLPAWPRQWNASFKLLAPKNTTIEARVQDGKVLDLKITPESRRKDVVVCQPFTS
jgi:hypothetical protein